MNRPTAIVGEGNPAHPEFVIPTDPKFRGRALSLWQAAGTQLMADGGIVGWLGDKAQKIGGAVMSGIDFLTDPGKMWEKATAFIRDKIKEIGSLSMAQMVGKVPLKMLSGLKDKIVNTAAGVFGGDSAGGGGGGSWARPVSAGLVKKGARVGAVGNTGNTTGPHHFEARRNGWTINPEPLLGYSGGGRPRAGEWAVTGELGPELVRFGRSAQVFTHDESLRLAEAAGAARAAVAAAPTSRAFASAPPAAPAAGLQPGDRLALRVGQAEFDAYVEAIAAGAVGTALAPLAPAISGRRG
ncbi:M23 family metallopeptidase [Streptomyces sp. NPDC020412]|uniref:M23 family metallopeptidase n=1 Tax=Streptomyces sp. NPDC020412 TaxID=3365073 RepID=UPI0037A52685